MDCVLDFVVKNKIPLTVGNYIQLSWWKDATLDDLEGEDRAEVEGLVEDDKLVDTENQFKQ